MGIKDGTYIRVSGTSRPAGRDLTAEMYYEDEGRSYDTVIRKDLTVTDEEIAEFFRKKYTSFPPSAHPELQYPAEGSTIIMKLRDNLSFPGKTYFAQFEIDHNGKVLRMVGEPKTPNLNRDYSKIYQGLLGQVMEYQEVK